MLPDNFSRTLCDLRKQANLSQEDLAERINVSRQAISKWERGEAYPDIENLIALSKLFDVSLDFLVYGTDNASAASDASNGSDTSDEAKANESKVKVKIGNGIKINIHDSDDDVDIDLEDNEDDDDDEDDDDPTVIESKKRFRLWYELPYPILVTIAYLLWGFLADGWEIGLTLYVTVPVYYSIIDCFRKKRLTPFCYPVFVAFVYLLMGMAWDLWHPWWILFISIPVFYPIASAIDKRR